jgi:hypothetical protein
VQVRERKRRGREHRGQSGLQEGFRRKEHLSAPALIIYRNHLPVLHLRSHSPDNVPECDGPPRISIHHDILTDKLWGHFVIGPKTGVIRVDDFYLGHSRVCNFNWRTRDMSSGQLRFGRGCEGIMEFGIHGVDKGSFYRLFDGIGVDFGTSNIARDTQMNWPDWMDQWEDYVKEAYNR